MLPSERPRFDLQGLLEWSSKLLLTPHLPFVYFHHPPVKLAYLIINVLSNSLPLLMFLPFSTAISKPCICMCSSNTFLLGNFSSPSSWKPPFQPLNYPLTGPLVLDPSKYYCCVCSLFPPSYWAPKGWPVSIPIPSPLTSQEPGTF